MKNLKKGFTLIELLVVIAIIGILSAVVLTSLSSARSKGKDGNIKASVSNLKSAAELYNNSNGFSYLDFCDSVTDQIADIAKFSTTVNANDCDDTASEYRVYVQLNNNPDETSMPNGAVWCIDSRGYSNVAPIDAQNSDSTVCETSI